MQLEKMQYTAQAHTPGAVGLLSRFLVVLFAATVSLASTTTTLAQPSARAGPKTQGAIKMRAAETKMNQKETKQ